MMYPHFVEQCKNWKEYTKNLEQQMRGLQQDENVKIVDIKEHYVCVQMYGDIIAPIYSATILYTK